MQSSCLLSDWEGKGVCVALLLFAWHMVGMVTVSAADTPVGGGGAPPPCRHCLVRGRHGGQGYLQSLCGTRYGGGGGPPLLMLVQDQTGRQGSPQSLPKVLVWRKKISSLVHGKDGQQVSAYSPHGHTSSGEDEGIHLISIGQGWLTGLILQTLQLQKGWMGVEGQVALFLRWSSGAKWVLSCRAALYQGFDQKEQREAFPGAFFLMCAYWHFWVVGLSSAQARIYKRAKRGGKSQRTRHLVVPQVPSSLPSQPSLLHLSESSDGCFIHLAQSFGCNQWEE